ncbi:hypothetical protein FACS189419_00010 [Planctomycetales bacterium]|nr:hypothetical protein FACS189419_00010 [Planctomycetales bacterium]
MNDTPVINQLLYDLLIILSAGFVAGVVCKWLKLPMVVGYLLIGAIIGSGVLGLFKSVPETEKPVEKPAAVSTDTAKTGTAKADAPKPDGEQIQPAVTDTEFDSSEEKTILVADVDEVEHRILDQFAHLGANLLLFAIGIHFAPSELLKTWKHFLVGGLIQMLGVILPFGLFFCLCGFDWKAGIVLGSAVSLSSTVLVFKSLEDMGMATSLSGMRAVTILLFQDVAIVPLMVLIGILSTLANGGQTASPVWMLGKLALHSTVFIVFIVSLRAIFVRWIVPFLLDLRNVELIVLFTMILLIGICGAAGYIGLPGALGALSAGVVLSWLLSP